MPLPQGEKKESTFLHMICTALSVIRNYFSLQGQPMVTPQLHNVKLARTLFRDELFDLSLYQALRVLETAGSVDLNTGRKRRQENYLERK